MDGYIEIAGYFGTNCAIDLSIGSQYDSSKLILGWGDNRTGTTWGSGQVRVNKGQAYYLRVVSAAVDRAVFVPCQGV